MSSAETGPGAPRRRRPSVFRRGVALGLVVALGAVALLPDPVLYRLAGAGAREEREHFHLYVVGGSSARGVPYAPHSFGLVVSRMFGGSIGGRPIALHVLAADGESIYAQAVRLRRVTTTRDPSVPGAVLVYSGHNDPVGPGSVDEPSWLDRFDRANFHHSLLREGIHGLRRLLRLPPRASLAGYELFLQRAVDDARGSGLLPVVSTVVSNVAGIEPNVPNASDGARAFRLLAGSPPLEGERCADAAGSAAAALGGIGGMEPLLVYLRARCLHQQGELPEAAEAYWRALELDPRTHFGRATPAQNEAVRKVARRAGIPLVETVARFEEASPGGIIGSSLFSDGHHPNLDGYLLIAAGFAEALATATGEEIVERYADAAAYLARHPMTPALASDPQLWGGTWLVATSALHPWPMQRLRLAERNYREATALTPHSFTAWAGLGISLAGQRGLLADRANVDRLARWRVFFSREFEVPFEELPRLLELLTAHGVDPAIVERIAESRGGRTPAR